MEITHGGLFSFKRGMHVNGALIADDVMRDPENPLNISQLTKVEDHFMTESLFIPLKGVIDIEIEIERLKKQLDAYNGRLKNVNGKLNNKNFINRAPKDIIENEQKKQSKYLATINKIQENLKSFLS